MTTHAHRFCHNCGVDLERDIAPIAIGEYVMQGEGYPLFWNDKMVRLTRTESAIVWSLMKAFPRAVRTEVLNNRAGCDADINTPAVLICRLRKKFRAAGIPDPIQTLREFGYYWVGGAADRPGGTIVAFALDLSDQ